MGKSLKCKLGFHSWEEKEKNEICKFCGSKKILDFNKRKWWESEG